MGILLIKQLLSLNVKLTNHYLMYVILEQKINKHKQNLDYYKLNNLRDLCMRIFSNKHDTQ